MDYSYLISEQEIVYSTLKNMIQKRHVPHAFIFYGDKSTSKKEMATLFIKMIYSDFLGLEIDSNPVFKRIDDDSSTNIFWIKKDKKSSISIDSVKDYIKETASSSLEEGPRFFIFEDGDSLNTSSSNAILKFVEEPVDDIYIIFLVENLSSLLDTIISRCVLLKFKPLDKDHVKNKLLEEGFEEEVLDVVLEYTQKEDKVREIMKDDDYMRLYSLSKDMFIEKFERTGSIVLYINDNYGLIVKDTEKTDFFLSLVLIYLMDVFNMMVSKSYEPIYKEEIDRIKRIAVLYKKDEFSEFLRELLNIKSNVNCGKAINLHLHLDNLFLKMELAARK